MPSLGEAYIEVHADTGPFDRELAASIEKALIAAEATMRSRGRDSGNAFGEGVKTAIDDHVKRIGDDMADGLEDAARKAGVRASAALADSIQGPDIQLGIDVPVRLGGLDDDELNDREARLTRWARSVAAGMNGALSATNRALSAFSAFFTQVSRMGTLFNPAVLVTGFGILGGAILGLLHILDPLLALIAALPGFLGVLGIQILVVAAAFNGLSNSIGKIFGADTLEDALKVADRFEGGIRNFMIGLAELSQVWRDIITISQDYFFKPFNDVLSRVAKVLGRGQFLAGIRDVAMALGQFATAFIGVFSSPAFISFVDALLPAVARITRILTGPFASLMNGLFTLMRVSLPFVEEVARIFGDLMYRFEGWVVGASKDGSLTKFFEDSLETLKLLGGVISSVWKLLMTFLSTLRETGVGDNFLKTIILVLDGLTKFFSSDLGQDAIVSMTQAAMGAIVLIGSLIITLTTLWQLMITTFQNIASIVSGIWSGIQWLGRKITDFFIWLAGGQAAARTSMVATWTTFTSTLTNAWNRFSGGFQQKFNEIRSFFRNMPSTLKNALGSLAGTLYNAGVNLIRGLIAGIVDTVPDLKDVLGWITNMIPNLKGPEDTDKKLLVNAGFQVMQGFRRGLALGAADVFSDLRAITGMIGVNANANSFLFGPGAITQNFNGAQPTTSAAHSLGSAVGSGIASAVNGQNMAASVRAI